MREPDQPYRPSAAAREFPGSPLPDSPGQWPIPADRLLRIEELAGLTARLIGFCAVPILLVFALVSLPINILELYTESRGATRLVQIGLWAVDLGGALGLLFVARDRLVSGTPASFESVVNRLAERYVSVLTTEALAFVAVIAGLLLLIVPGVFAAIYLAFSMPAAALRDRRNFAALAYSKDLVSSRAGDVLGRLLVLSLPLIALSAITVIASVAIEQGYVAPPVDWNEYLILGLAQLWWALLDLVYLPISFGGLILFLNLERIDAARADGESGDADHGLVDGARSAGY